MREQPLLDAWEAALAAPPGWRPAALVGALEALPWPDLAAWTAGRVNARLLAVHGSHFGPALEGLTRCPHCREAVEITLPLATLLAQAPVPAASPAPTLGQLWEATTEASDAAARDALFGSTPAADRPALEASWATADPLGVVDLAVNCPACGAAWEDSFNPGPFVWRKLDAWAEGVLDDVALLAKTYGWREADVLALSAARRRRYLERAWG